MILFSQFGLNSVESAPGIFKTSLAYSINASCIPKQSPKYGIFFVLAYLIAAIFPWIPLFPNPPGTIIPLTPLSNSLILFSFISSELTQWISTFLSNA